MRRVIVNSTPLIILCKIGKLDILKELYKEIIRADLIIIDDNAAKKTAKYLGLTVTGTIGVLLRAKKQGILETLAPLIGEMKQKGFYISNDLEEMRMRYFRYKKYEKEKMKESNLDAMTECMEAGG